MGRHRHVTGRNTAFSGVPHGSPQSRAFVLPLQMLCRSGVPHGERCLSPLSSGRGERRLLLPCGKMAPGGTGACHTAHRAGKPPGTKRVTKEDLSLPSPSPLFFVLFLINLLKGKQNRLLHSILSRMLFIKGL